MSPAARRALVPLVVLAALAVASCGSDGGTTGPKATRTNFVVYGTYAGAALDVSVNGQPAGQTAGPYGGSTSCVALLQASPSEGVVTVSAFVGQTYSVRAQVSGGRYWQWNPVTVTQDMVDAAPCYAFVLDHTP